MGWSFECSRPSPRSSGAGGSPRSRCGDPSSAHSCLRSGPGRTPQIGLSAMTATSRNILYKTCKTKSNSFCIDSAWGLKKADSQIRKCCSQTRRPDLGWGEEPAGGRVPAAGGVPVAGRQHRTQPLPVPELRAEGPIAPPENRHGHHSAQAQGHCRGLRPQGGRPVWSAFTVSFVLGVCPTGLQEHVM